MSSRVITKRKKELGQFLTPTAIADFMASLFVTPRKDWRILDAGAGCGALSLALITHICRTAKHGTSLSVTAYELDDSLIPTLIESYEAAKKECHGQGVHFSFSVRHQDFIQATAEKSREELFSTEAERFNATILNPPYRKVASNSQTRRDLRSAGIETSNLYTGFLALASQLLENDGEMVAITPRSFCNGPYFRPFRKFFLSAMSLRRIHVFESRSAAFGGDGVLQENVIVHSIKSQVKAEGILISSSSGESNGPVTEKEHIYSDVISPSDPDSFIHLATEATHEDARAKMAQLDTTLPDLGLTVSTGRVVDFRAVEYLRADQESDAVPLIRPCHIRDQVVTWPNAKQKKLCAIANVGATASLLLPADIYVVVKRFSAKEERRRIVAAVYDPSTAGVSMVGFENHLNYFHCQGHGFNIRLAKGLCAFLNSSTVDSYFRHFSGHTQVNASDLRRIKYPSLERLESLGDKISVDAVQQKALDDIVHQEVF